MIRDFIRKVNGYYREHGLKGVIRRIIQKIKGEEPYVDSYTSWLKWHLPDNDELESQRECVFSREPLISLIVPVYKTPYQLLTELIKSVKSQTYSNWQLCISDGSGCESKIRTYLKKMSVVDGRIKLNISETPLGIVDNSNAALSMADGEYVAFLDHDDLLTANALYECVRLINEKEDVQVIYSDEDKVSLDGAAFFEPQMKPDFNLDLLCTVNYICHLFVVRKDLLDRVGNLNCQYEGAQDYDLVFRCVEAAEHIEHIPKILYHWRSFAGSTSENPESKRYAFDAGRRAVQAHYDRLKIPATVTDGEFLGLYRTKYNWQEKPLVSIIIPNKDHISDLQKCICSINKKSTYTNYELIIVENNSTEPETFEYYEKLKESMTNVRVIEYKGGFNYSKINNYAVKYAGGDYLLFLNNDTEVINDDCIEQLLGYCMRDDVGAVGARLYYNDGTIQHAGVIIGFGGIAGHAFVQHPHNATGYCHRIISAQDLSAVTAACMMVKKKAFDEVGGFSEELAVAFNDIDFCMKLRKAGWLIVYNPYAELYHYESKSRGLEDTPEKIKRFNHEIEMFAKKWPKILCEGDPYYNPNLTLESQDFSLKKIPMQV